WPGFDGEQMIANSIVENPPINTLVTVGGTSSLPDEAEGAGENLTIRPQPASSEVRIEHYSSTQSRPWRLVDLEGRTVVTGEVPAGSSTTVLSVLNIPVGHYIFVVD